jgi:hypothetical protein
MLIGFVKENKNSFCACRVHSPEETRRDPNKTRSAGDRDREGVLPDVYAYGGGRDRAEGRGGVAPGSGGAWTEVRTLYRLAGCRIYFSLNPCLYAGGVTCYSVVVRRKRTRDSAEPVSESIVPEVIVEQARRAIEEERVKTAHCVVCGSECAPNSSEGLCWVCRRLKLSAWRDSDSQMTAQE